MAAHIAAVASDSKQRHTNTMKTT